jgi:hypothetical protein
VQDGEKSCFTGSEIGKVFEDNGLCLWEDESGRICVACGGVVLSSFDGSAGVGEAVSLSRDAHLSAIRLREDGAPNFVVVTLRPCGGSPNLADVKNPTHAMTLHEWGT